MHEWNELFETSMELNTLLAAFVFKRIIKVNI